MNASKDNTTGAPAGAPGNGGNEGGKMVDLKAMSEDEQKMRISSFGDLEKLVVRCGYKFVRVSLGSELKTGHGKPEARVFIAGVDYFTVMRTMGRKGRIMATSDALRLLQEKCKIKIVEDKEDDWLVEVIA
jgi:hypothetical protein